MAQARAAFARGDDAATLRALQAVLVATPTAADALALGVNAALRSGALLQAAAWLETLHHTNPAHAQFRRLLSTVHNNLGAQHLQAGDRSAASAGFARALEVWADNAEALFNRARLAIEARQPARALLDLQRLRDLRPDDLPAALLRAETEIALGAEDARARLQAALGEQGLRAVDPLRIALALADGGEEEAAAGAALAVADPARALAVADVAYRLAENSAAAVARQVHARVATLCGKRAPGLFARIASKLSLPQVYADHAALDDARAGFASGLDDLAELSASGSLAGCEPLLEQLAWSNQMLAYQGRDDRDLLTRHAGFLEQALDRFAPALREAPAPGRQRRQRIGFVSAAFRESTIGAYFAAWVGAATAAGHETVVVQLPPAWDATTTRIGASATHLLRPQGTLLQIASAIRAQQLDLLVYPDLGVDGRVSVLAALRLAPRQAMAWGHPSTSGLSTIDACFSCAAMEPPGAPSHYRESLLPLPGIGTAYQRPQPSAALPRASLGLPADRCYLVPQAPFKVHPDTDATLAAIAATDREGTVVLFRGERPGTTRRLHARLSAALRAAGADPARQLLFLPMTDRTHFLATCAACDVMVDTPHWSGGNTTIDALLSGLPVVALPGALMRGRQSAAMLGILDLPELVCSDAAAQARVALAVAGDPAWRGELGVRMAAGLEHLFDGRAALVALQEHLQALLARDVAPGRP